MKIKITQSLFFFLMVMTYVSWGQTNPSPFNLSGGNFTFTSFTTGGSIAYHAFILTNTTPDAYTSAQQATMDWPCSFSLTGRARFLDAGTDGLTVVNTAQGQNSACSGNGNADSRRPLSMVVALNSTGRENIAVNWTVRTVTQADNDRVYAIQLQYRIGETGSFTDVSGGGVSSSTTGSSSSPSVTLPTVCNNKPIVQVRWVYYPISGSGGSRPTMQLDEITISSSLLPVELIWFKYDKKLNSTLLVWQTASELNNSHFSIERSTDGNRYQEIGIVQGHGTSHAINDYSFTDERPAPGINYYRLKQVDFDGQFEYSKVVSVHFGGGKGEVRLYPTVASSEVQVRFPSPSEEAGSVQVFDLNGRLVKQMPFEPEMDGLTLPTDDLQNGQYLVKVLNGQVLEVLRFVKQ